MNGAAHQKAGAALACHRGIVAVWVVVAIKFVVMVVTKDGKALKGKKR
jgi:hypothetical protein